MSYRPDEMVELTAQIFLTALECTPDFDDLNMNDVLEFLGVKKRDRTHMNRLVLSNEALKLIHEENNMDSNTVYELISEDLSHLGGPMGTEYTTESSLGLFSGEDGLEKAKKAAEKHYGGKIKWSKDKYPEGSLCSGDLRYVMYHIRIRRVK